MRNPHLPPSVLAAVLSACATESVILNSERIEQRFGNYGVDVLASEARLRRSSLVSQEDNVATCRTYAVVQFAEQLDNCYGEAHSKVLAGDSIGATFKESGWGIQKHTLHTGPISLPQEQTQVAELMRLEGAHELALHVYQLQLAKDDQVFDYATILEAHHPDYLSTTELRKLFNHDAQTTLPETDLAELERLVFGP